MSSGPASLSGPRPQRTTSPDRSASTKTRTHSRSRSPGRHRSRSRSRRSCRRRSNRSTSVSRSRSRRRSRTQGSQRNRNRNRNHRSRSRSRGRGRNHRRSRSRDRSRHSDRNRRSWSRSRSRSRSRTPRVRAASAVTATTMTTTRTSSTYSRSGGDGGGQKQHQQSTASDAPIVAAIPSHRTALAAVKKRMRSIEVVTSDPWSNHTGMTHEVEKLEVALTDQLLAINTMLDDCITDQGRQAVKGGWVHVRHAQCACATYTFTYVLSCHLSGCLSVRVRVFASLCKVRLHVYVCVACVCTRPTVMYVCTVCMYVRTYVRTYIHTHHNITVLHHGTRRFFRFRRFDHVRTHARPRAFVDSVGLVKELRTVAAQLAATKRRI